MAREETKRVKTQRSKGPRSYLGAQIKRRKVSLVNGHVAGI